MSASVIFFRQRDRDTGKTYDLRLNLGEHTVRIATYTRVDVGKQISASIPRGTFKTKKAYEEALQQFKEVIARRGGGLVVEIRQEDTTERLVVNVCRNEGYRPPELALVLPPGFPPRYERLTTLGKHHWGTGHHLIVPVDNTEEEQLKGFVSSLRGFSPDTEALLLNTLRRPNLEARVDRLERPTRRRLSIVRGLALFGLLVAITVGLIAIELGSRSRYSALETELKQIRSSQYMVSYPPAGAEVSIRKSVDERVRVLCTSLASSSSFRSLYDEHFKGDCDIGKLKVAWGFFSLYRLYVLRNVSRSESSDSDPGPESTVVEFFRRNKKEISGTNRSMLIYVGCTAMDFPGLSAADQETVRLAKTCGPLDPAMVLQGIDRLIEFVNPADAEASDADFNP